MSCAYCKENRKLSGEHLIPMGLIDLFPECDINFMLEKAFKSENVVINDVCEKCNNENLSKLDNYGIDFVKRYFVRNYEKNVNLPLTYNYTLLSRWLLKILYNIARANKIDTNWFDNNLNYILGREETPNLQFSVFSGVAVDMSPLPEFYFDNMKLGVFFEPVILKDSFLEIKDFSTRSFNKRESTQEITFSDLCNSAILRFGSGLFLVFLWNIDKSVCERKENEETIQSKYPYSLLDNESDLVALKRVTHAFNYHNYHMIDTSSGVYIADQTNSFLPYNINPVENRKALSKKWNDHVMNERKNRAEKRKREREKKNRKKK